MTVGIPIMHVDEEVGVVCDPLDASASPALDQDRSVAVRPESLAGRVLAVIDNGFYKQSAGLGLGELLVERLRKEADLADVMYVRKDAVNVPPRPEDWDAVCRGAHVGLTLYGA
jgi:hypothetical protein